MDYKPQYPQPFTLAQARALDVSVISEEISRLQNSLKHLKETQDLLEAELRTKLPDADITQAFEENRAVIGSQEERITILKMAISEKGIIPGSHYDLAPNSQPLSTQPNSSHATTSSIDTVPSDVEGDGVYL